MLKVFALALAASVALNAAMVFVGRGSITHVFMLIAAFWLLVILTMAGGVILLFGRRRPILRRIGTGALVAAAVLMSSVVSIPLGSRVNRADIERAKEFCDRLRPELERQKRETGRYPDHPFPDSAGARLPRLLRGIDFYDACENHYTFSFYDPSELFGFVDYDSRNGTWVEWTD